MKLKQMTVYIPEAVLEHIKRQAAANLRSATKEIELRLTQSMQQELSQGGDEYWREQRAA